jgi:hypothetical protein
VPLVKYCASLKINNPAKVTHKDAFISLNTNIDYLILEAIEMDVTAYKVTNIKWNRDKND